MKPRVLAGFSLQEIGGPPPNERPDATGLFADGRFADFSAVRNRAGDAGNFQNRQNNELHSLTVSDDGERVYVAGGTAGFYVLDSEGYRASQGCRTRSGNGGMQPAFDDRFGERHHRWFKACRHREGLPAHGREQRSRD